MKAISPIISIIILLLITIAIAGAGYSYLSVYWTGMTSKQIQVISAFCSAGSQGKITVKNIGTSSLNTSDIRVTDAQTGQDINQDVLWSSEVSDSSRVLELRFDEGEGTTTHDTSGQGNDGTLEGGTSWVDGKYGNALSFDGTANYMSLAADANALDITGDISVSLWFYPDVLDSNLITNRYRFGGNEYGYHLQTKADGTVLWSSHDGATNVNAECVAHSTGTITVSQWNHIIVTKAGDSTTIYFYINGEPAGTDTVAATGIEYSASYTSREIGTSSDSYTYSGSYEFGSKHYTDGTIDEVNIYSRVLSPDEIKSLAENLVTLQPGETASMSHTCSGMCRYNLILGGMGKEAMLEC